MKIEKKKIDEIILYQKRNMRVEKIANGAKYRNDKNKIRTVQF